MKKKSDAEHRLLVTVDSIDLEIREAKTARKTRFLDGYVLGLQYAKEVLLYTFNNKNKV